MLLQLTNPCHQTKGRYLFLVTRESNANVYPQTSIQLYTRKQPLMILVKVATHFQLRILDTYHLFHEAIAIGKEILVFCDISKAFDSLRQRAIAQIDWHGTQLGQTFLQAFHKALSFTLSDLYQ